MTFWSAPEILVVHLKRFGRDKLTGPIEKISHFVDCPITSDPGASGRFERVWGCVKVRLWKSEGLNL